MQAVIDSTVLGIATLTAYMCTHQVSHRRVRTQLLSLPKVIGQTVCCRTTRCKPGYWKRRVHYMAFLLVFVTLQSASDGRVRGVHAWVTVQNDLLNILPGGKWLFACRRAYMDVYSSPYMECIRSAQFTAYLLRPCEKLDPQNSCVAFRTHTTLRASRTVYCYATIPHTFLTVYRTTPHLVLRGGAGFLRPNDNTRAQCSRAVAHHVSATHQRRCGGNVKASACTHRALIVRPFGRIGGSPTPAPSLPRSADEYACGRSGRRCC